MLKLIKKLQHKLIILTFLSLFSQINLAKAEISANRKIELKNSEDEFNFEEDESSSLKINDPFEKINRTTYKFNNLVDKILLKPIVNLYRYTPQPIRKATRNFLNNLSLPLSAFNSLLQGKIDNSLANTSTFLINSTIGIFGTIDIASHRGLLYNKEDFGQTLGSYGIKSGPYIVLPILGPSSTLNLAGEIMDRTISPFGFNSLNLFSKQPLSKNENRLIFAIASAIDKRDQLDPLITSVNQESLDPYATIRSAYLQNRQFEILK